MRIHFVLFPRLRGKSILYSFSFLNNSAWLFYLVLCAMLLSLSSCATIFNSKLTGLKVVTSEPSRLVINQQDTVSNLSVEKNIAVNRDKKPLNLLIYNDSLIKEVNVNYKLSSTSFLNFYFSYLFWVGYIVDANTKKLYTYPKLVYVDFHSPGYLTHMPFENIYSGKTIYKFTPLKLIGIVNPAVELLAERNTSEKFSSQLKLSYLLPISLWDMGYDFHPRIEGFSAAFEEKFYINETAPMGPYVSAEIDYLNNEYRDVSLFMIDNSVIDSLTMDHPYEDVYTIKKQTISFNCKFGYQFFKNNMSFDIYMGLGVRYKMVSHSDRVNPDNMMAYPHYPSLSYAKNREGNYWSMSLPLNIRVGWVF
jgi:hypothetical protein